MSTTKGDNDKDENFKRQGSFRKLLPTNANGDSQLSMSVKMIDRPNISQTNKDYAVFLQEYNILSEYNILRIQDLKGIYVIPSAQNSFGLACPDNSLYNFNVTISKRCLSIEHVYKVSYYLTLVDVVI